MRLQSQRCPRSMKPHARHRWQNGHEPPPLPLWSGLFSRPPPGCGLHAGPVAGRVTFSGCPSRRERGQSAPDAGWRGLWAREAGAEVSGAEEPRACPASAPWSPRRRFHGWLSASQGPGPAHPLISALPLFRDSSRGATSQGPSSSLFVLAPLSFPSDGTCSCHSALNPLTSNSSPSTSH